MLIGIDASRALRARRTGTERYSLEIIRHLLRLPQAAGHSWRLYTDGQDIDAWQDLAVPASNVDICCMPARRLWTHRTLASEIVRRPPDVLFVPAHVVPWLPPLAPPAAHGGHDPRSRLSCLSGGASAQPAPVFGAKHALERHSSHTRDCGQPGDGGRPGAFLWRRPGQDRRRVRGLRGAADRGA